MRRRILGEISTIPYMSLSACWISTIPAGTACPLNAHWVVRDDREISPCVRCPQLACGTYWIATFKKKKIQFCLNITLIKKEVLCTFRLWLMQVKTNCWVNYRRYYYTVSNRGRGLKERSGVLDIHVDIHEYSCILPLSGIILCQNACAVSVN